jgi:hypothetical protein
MAGLPMERISSDELRLTDALLFLAISFVIGWGLEISFLKQNPLIDLASSAIFFMFSVMTFGGAVCLAWRLVKGAADINKFFVIHFYYAGVIKLIMACTVMAAIGVLKAFDHQLYEEFMNATYQGQNMNFMIRNSERFIKSDAGIPLISISSLLNIVMLIWIIAGWGAYREINHLSGFRSGAAFILLMLFSIPINVVVYLLANADVR